MNATDQPNHFKVKIPPKTISPSRTDSSTSTPTAAQITAFGDRAATRNTDPLPTTFFSLVTESRRVESVVVKGQIRRGDVGKSSYLMIPGPTYERIQKMMMGPMTPGIIGLIEYALDELDRQDKTLVIDNFK